MLPEMILYLRKTRPDTQSTAFMERKFENIHQAATEPTNLDKNKPK